MPPNSLKSPLPPERIAVIPNGINQVHFATAPTPQEAKARLGLQGKLVFGFTGFVRDWHGVDRVITWMASPQAPAHTHLLVVGDGPVRAELEALAASLGIAKRVAFTGVIDRHRVPEHVAAFDIALQPAVTAYASPSSSWNIWCWAKPSSRHASPTCWKC